MPTGILEVPHAVIRDYGYMGYKIPKEAGVMWNVWGIHMDPKRHTDPCRFDPADTSTITRRQRRLPTTQMPPSATILFLVLVGAYVKVCIMVSDRCSSAC